MQIISAAVFLLTLTWSSPAKARKCPKECSCDNTKLTVGCVGKNLTDIPPTMDEVRNSNCLNESFLCEPLINDTFCQNDHFHALIFHTDKCVWLFVLSFSFSTFAPPDCKTSVASVVVWSLFQITVRLDLRNNNLQMLSRGAFTHTPYLTHLNLQRCNIVKVKEGAFRALGRLVSLNLAHNKIDILYQVISVSKDKRCFFCFT